MKKEAKINYIVNTFTGEQKYSYRDWLVNEKGIYWKVYFSLPEFSRNMLKEEYDAYFWDLY